MRGTIKEVVMGVYLIDFENTREAGLRGVEGLDKNDILYILQAGKPVR